MNTPRLRIFAGPNGSGKSTLKSVISDKLLGVYINPDDIEKDIKEIGFLDFNIYKIKTDKNVLNFFINHSLIIKMNLVNETKKIKFIDNRLYFKNIEMNSYFASVLSDFIRRELIKLKISFSFETVMSSPDKIELLKIAQKNGYRTYLYYIATQDPIINISRVKNRVKLGGHNVPEDKIVSRYYKSLKLLKDAIKYSNRVYIFDNSSYDKVWLCEINSLKEVELKVENMPYWLYEYLLRG
jgi:predicted ABC-type ATPase